MGEYYIITISSVTNIGSSVTNIIINNIYNIIVSRVNSCLLLLVGGDSTCGW